MIRSLLDDHSTMSGGGRHAIESGFESPKHCDSLGLLVNSYVHRGHYTQAQWNTSVSHEAKQHMYVEIA